MNNFERKNPPKKPIFEKLDISKAETWNGMQGYKDFIISRLKELGLYSPDLVYRGFDGSKINIVKKHGTDKPTEDIIFGSTEEDLGDVIHGGSQDALAYALSFNKVGGLSVYDKSKLEVIDRVGIFRPKSGHNFKEALVVSFELREK